MNFTDINHPNPQVQYLETVSENNTKDPIATPAGVLGCVDFPEENYDLQPPPQPYTVYNLNQVAQTFLSRAYPFTFESKQQYDAQH